MASVHRGPLPVAASARPVRALTGVRIFGRDELTRALRERGITRSASASAASRSSSPAARRWPEHGRAAQAPSAALQRREVRRRRRPRGCGSRRRRGRGRRPPAAILRVRSASTPGRSSTSTTTTSRSRVTASVRDRQRVPGGLRVRDEDVQLGALVRPEARGRRDVHAGVADRGRDLRQRAGRVLDVDDQVDRHGSAGEPIQPAAGGSTASSAAPRRRAGRASRTTACVCGVALHPRSSSGPMIPRSTERTAQRRGTMIRGLRASIPRDDRLAGPRGRAGACAAAFGSVGDHLVGERVLVDRPVDHLGVDEAEVGDARARAVLDELDAQRAAELLDGGLAHRVRDRADAVR